MYLNKTFKMKGLMMKIVKEIYSVWLYVIKIFRKTTSQDTMSTLTMGAPVVPLSDIQTNIAMKEL